VILLRPICWLLGHRRGKLVLTGPLLDKRLVLTRTLKVFRCPRCNGNERRYKIKPPARSSGAELDSDPDYARQDAEARESPTNHPHKVRG